ncbi:MAG: M13 family metallopeptidase [Crocinitomicaceae bacterium]|jgi:putative endopeptidase
MKKIVYTLLLAGATTTLSAQKISIDTSFMDKSIRPKDDFYKYCNGKWLKNNPVPSNESRWGSMNELDNSNKTKLIEVLESARKNPKNTNEKLIGNYYASFMDTIARNSLNISPIKNDLNKIQSIQNKEQLSDMIAYFQQQGINLFFSVDVQQDLKNTTKNSLYINQAGLGLPNNQFYIQENKKAILIKYQTYLETLLSAIGVTNNQKMASNTVNLETKLAKQMMNPAELRDPEKTYNKLSISQFANNFTTFDINHYFSKIATPSLEFVVIGQPDYFKQLNSIIETTSLEEIKDYIYCRVSSYYSSKLSNDIAKINFSFYSVTLSGKSTDKPLPDKAVNEITNLAISELLGQCFVQKHYSKNAQKKINTMVDLLIESYDERLNTLSWMSDGTKNEARKKLHAIKRKLGFPEKYEDFSALDLNPTTYIENLKKIKLWEFNHAIESLTKEVDKSKWEMPAHMINAYYQPLNNEIVFPAGIMQAPFFDENAEDAVNYSRIGMIIGHELTHGFDDMGAKFDLNGGFNNWWSEKDKIKFEDKTKQLGETYTHFCPIEGHCVDAQLTMGENIADLGGVILAFNAYKKTNEYKSGKKLFGYTPEQRFFIAMAQIYKINFTEQELKNRLSNDPHSPGMYRVNGPLMNFPAFFDAFEIKEGDAMRNPKEKLVEIW